MQGSDKRFIIPVYQRNYDWKTENCKQLYDDLIKVVRRGRKSHFFGSIVSVHNDSEFNEYLVIDGQQRLTTISLLLLAMYNLMKNGVLTPAKGNLAEKIYKTEAFDYLFGHKAEIEATLGSSVEWLRSDNTKGSYILVRLEGVSIENEADWTQMAKFHAEWSKKFYDAFVPYLKQKY